jgi:Mn-dependent DtxR family transcriptional regulator
MNLQESGEMYLETILRLTDKNENVRSVDVSEEMGFSKPSVSRAIGLLRSGGYVNVSAEGYLSLTDIGREVAMKVYERHKLITELLLSLGVDKETAVADACRMEHCISDESFAAIKKYIEKKG